MSVIGTVDSLWRYPVKSMRGEQLDELFINAAGVQGDRLFAFGSSASRVDFPYFTAREQREMLRYRPKFCSEGKPPVVEVETPDGVTVAIDDPTLLDRLRFGADEKHHLNLMRSDRPLTDAQPVSIFSLQTVQKLGEETGAAWDKRRFRANIYVDLPGSEGFAEDAFVGASIRIGSQLVLSVVKRNGRCVIINLDPDSVAVAPALLKNVARAHDGNAGLYATAIVEGAVRTGDSVELLE